MLKNTKAAKAVLGMSVFAFALTLSVSVAGAAGYTFTRSLTVGSTGEDVKQLQMLLNQSADTQVAASGVGSAGSESTYFGSKTRSAVAKFQTKYGITPPAGYFGPITRAKANEIGAGSVSTTPSSTPGCAAGALYSSTTGAPCAAGTPVVSAPAGTGLSISAGTQPAASLAPTSANRVPFTKVVLTAGNDGDVTVNSITVQRTGLGNNAVFAGVVLLDEDGLQIGVAKTLNSNDQVLAGEAFVVKKGTSRTITIAGNMASSLSSYAGQVVTLSVVGINTSATVTGSLPITGAGHTINATLSLGSATLTLSSFDPNSTGITKEIGTTGYKFAGVRVTAGSAEKIRLWSIRWNQTGSAGTGDLSNVKTYVDGTAFDTSVSSDGKYYTATFVGGIVIDKGLSKDVYVQGDMVGSASSARTVQFDIYKATDIYMTGETFGYGATPTSSGNCNATASTATDASEFINSSTSCASSGTVGTPFLSASKVTISAGSVTSVNRALSVAAQNIAVNVPNQILGGYEVDLKGEPISVQSHVFTISSTTGSGTGLLTNISIYDENGAIVAGPVDGVFSSGLDQTATFSDTVTYPVGKRIYTLKGKIASGIGNGGTYIVKTTPSTQWTNVTGQTTGNTISLSSLSTQTVMNTMTVRGASLGISISTQPPAQNVITGSQGFTYAKLLLDASQSGEDVKFSSIPLSMTFATMVVSEVTSCQLFDGSTALNTGSNVVNPSGASDANVTFTLDQQIVTAKGTVKTLDLKCNLASSVSASDTVSWGINAAPSITVTGVTSGNDVTETVTAAAGQTMTVAASGSYTVTNDAALLYKTAQAGATNVEIARLRFTAGASEKLYLQQVALQLGNTASNSPADLLGQTVTLWNGATQIGTAQFGVGNSPDNATSTLLSPTPAIEAGESVVISVKGSMTVQNVNEGTPGAFLAITYDGDNVGVNGNYATGASSQSSISSGTTADVTTNGLRIFRTVPTVAVTSTGGTGTLQAGADLYKFTVTNPNSRDVVFQKFTFSIATTGSATLSVNAFTLYGDGVAFNTTAVTLSDTQGADMDIPASGTSNAQVVPANSTKTFVLKAATVNNPSTTVIDSVTLALLADTSYPSLANNMGTVTTVEAGSANTDNIVWSPFSTTTPVATAATQDNLDWTNGFGMPGFPSNTAFPVQTWTSAN